MVPARIDNAPVFDLCSAREKRFLLDLIQQEEPGARDDHPIPELYALLRAMERMWGGADAKELRVPSMLKYYLVAYAMMAHHIQQDVAEWRRGAVFGSAAVSRGSDATRNQGTRCRFPPHWSPGFGRGKLSACW